MKITNPVMSEKKINRKKWSLEKSLQFTPGIFISCKSIKGIFQETLYLPYKSSIHHKWIKELSTEHYKRFDPASWVTEHKLKNNFYSEHSNTFIIFLGVLTNNIKWIFVTKTLITYANKVSNLVKTNFFCIGRFY